MSYGSYMFTTKGNPGTGSAPGTGNAFRDMRIEAGLTADSVARHAGISPSHLSRFEQDTRTVAPATYRRLLAALRTAPKEVSR